MSIPENHINSWVIKQRYFTRQPKTLLFKSHSIEFGNQKLTLPTTIDLSKEEPIQYRFGIKWISGYKFIIGRKYQLFIRNNDGETVKISFGSYYGINKNALRLQYSEMLNRLWEIYFDNLVEQYLEMFSQKVTFSLAKVIFSESGIKITTSNFSKNEKHFLPWHDVGTQNYQTYFAIFSINKPATINKGYNYLNDWNTGLLYSVVETILKRTEIKLPPQE